MKRKTHKQSRELIGKLQRMNDELTRKLPKRLARRINDELALEAKEIQKRAISYAPVDYSDLEHAIVYFARQGRNAKGQFDMLEHYVAVDVNYVCQDPRDHNKLVGEYAYIVHEKMGTTQNGSYAMGDERSRDHPMPGPKSYAKAALLGTEVGGKFMARAFADANADHGLFRRIEKATRQEIAQCKKVFH